MERREETADYVVQDGAKEHAVHTYQVPAAKCWSGIIPCSLNVPLCRNWHICINIIGHSLLTEVSHCKNKVYRIKSFWSSLLLKLEDIKAIFHKMALSLSLSVRITDSNLRRENINNIQDKNAITVWRSKSASTWEQRCFTELGQLMWQWRTTHHPFSTDCKGAGGSCRVFWNDVFWKARPCSTCAPSWWVPISFISWATYLRGST